MAWFAAMLAAALLGTGWRERPPLERAARVAGGQGYWLVSSDGGVFNYGDAGFFGAPGSVPLDQPIVGMATTPTAGGYWLVGSNGTVYSFGDARIFGDARSVPPNQRIVGMAATTTGGGYWLVASDGGVFSFGDAGFFGSAGSLPLNQPMVGMAATPTGGGYWLVASDGGVFSFGDAGFFGSAGSVPPNQAVVGMAATTTGGGYWLVASNGGIIHFGDAGMYGSAGSVPLNQPIGGLAATPTGEGYWLVASDGGVFSFGDAGFFGSAGSGRRNQPIVGMAGTPQYVVNELPRASDDSMGVVEDGSVAADVLANDAGLGDGGITVTVESPPAHGATAVEPDGLIRYRPEPDFSGGDSFTYRVTDVDGESSAATVAVTVTPVNDLPTVSPVTDQVVSEDTATGPISFSVADAESDAGRLALSHSSSDTDLVPNESIVLSGSGARRTITVTPAPDANGTVTIRITAADPDGGAGSTSFALTITPVNDAPVPARDLGLITDEDTPTAATLEASDVDEGDVLTFAIATDGKNGTATVTDPARGDFTYTPKENVNGPDTFTFTVTDGAGQAATASVAVEIDPVNDPPVAAGQQLTTAEDNSISGRLAATDPDDDPLTYAIATGGTKGTATVTDPAAGTFTYEPNPDASGRDSFTFRVTDAGGASTAGAVAVTITEVNDLPAISDVADQSIKEDTATGALPILVGDVETAAADLDLSARSSDPDLVPDGNIELTGTGADRTVAVTPAEDANGGPVTITLTVTDDDGGMASQDFTVTVEAVNDVPKANPDTATVAEDGQARIAVLANDTGLGDGGIVVTLLSEPDPAKGRATANPDGTVTFVPARDVSGQASFAYAVEDRDGDSSAATVAVTITPVNDLPTVSDVPAQTTEEDTAAGPLTVTVGDVETPAGELELSATSSDPAIVPDANIAIAPGATDAERTVTVKPAENASGGPVTITLTATDAEGGEADRAFTLTVTPVNDPPVATPDQRLTTDEDAPATGTLGASDVDGDPLTFTAANGMKGTVTVDDPATGDITYTPAENANGPDTFTFTVSDGKAGPVTGTVEVTITGVNDAPSVSEVRAQTTEEDSAVGPLTVTVGDVETPPREIDLTATSSDPAIVPDTNITIAFGAIDAQRTVTVEPAENANGGPVTITLRATDAEGATTETAFALTVTPVNDSPMATLGQKLTTTEDTPGTGTLEATDVDLDEGDSLTFRARTDQSKGTVVVDDPATGAFTYTPNRDANGEDTIAYTVTDQAGESPAGTVIVTITPVNDPPVATADQSLALAEDTPAPGTLGATDAEGDALTFSAADGMKGSVTVTDPATGAFTYAPAENANGEDTIPFTVTDGKSEPVRGTVAVTITPVNDPPVATPDQSLTTAEDTPGTGTLGATDPDVDNGDKLTFKARTDASTGTVVVDDPATGAFTYTPNPEANGSDTITFTVTDAAGASDTGTVAVTITPVNDPPTISDIPAQTTEEDAAAVTITVTVGDVETPAGELGLTASSSDPAIVPDANITIAPGPTEAERTVTVDPAENASGPVTITLTATDAEGGMREGAFTLTVAPVNDPPVAADDSATAAPGTSTTIDVRANDGDVDHSPSTLRVVINSVPAQGSLSCNASAGTCTYEANTGATGTDSFTYRLRDPDGALSNVATVTITIT